MVRIIGDSPLATSKGGRLAKLLVTVDLLDAIIKSKGTETHCKVVTNHLPADAKFICCYVNPGNRRLLELVYESEDFHMVEFGDNLPVLPPLVFETVKEIK